jgi:hypothetical protein
MNNNSHNQMPSMQVRPRIITRPAPVQALYGKVLVSEPMLIQSPSIFGLSQPPHWSYQVCTQLPAPPNSNSSNNNNNGGNNGGNNNNNGGGGGVWLVRRRFRHAVSLEDRLRQDCPGAILPPRYVPYHYVTIIIGCYLLVVLFAKQCNMDVGHTV